MYTSTARSLILQQLADGSRLTVTEIYNRASTDDINIGAFQSAITYVADSGEVTPVAECENVVVYALTGLIKTEELEAIRSFENETCRLIIRQLKQDGAATKIELRNKAGRSNVQVLNALKSLIRRGEIYSYIDIDRGRTYRLLTGLNTTSLRTYRHARICLRCGKDFVSTWCGNRVCQACKNINRDLEGGFAELEAHA